MTVCVNILVVVSCESKWLIQVPDCLEKIREGCLTRQSNLMPLICKLGTVLDSGYIVSFKIKHTLISLVSRTIIDHHEGRIGVSSTLGMGSTFYLELKLVAFPNHCSALKNAEDRSSLHMRFPDGPHFNTADIRSDIISDVHSRLEQDYRFNRVLIVDDSKLNRKMLSRQLKNIFNEIIEVRDFIDFSP